MTATQTKGKHRVGDEGFHVQWVSHIPTDEYGDLDRDHETAHCAFFVDRSEAWEYAKTVYPQDQYGAVVITPVRFAPYDEDHAAAYPHVGFWESTGDSDYYEGE